MTAVLDQLQAAVQEKRGLKQALEDEPRLREVFLAKNPSGRYRVTSEKVSSVLAKYGYKHGTSASSIQKWRRRNS